MVDIHRCIPAREYFVLVDLLTRLCTTANYKTTHLLKASINRIMRKSKLGAKPVCDGLVRRLGGDRAAPLGFLSLSLRRRGGRAGSRLAFTGAAGFERATTRTSSENDDES